MLWRRQVIVRTPVGALQIITPLIARHNVYNILAAVAVGLAVTVDGEPIPLKVLAHSGPFSMCSTGPDLPDDSRVFGRGMHGSPKMACSLSTVPLWALAWGVHGRPLPLRVPLSLELLCEICISS